MNIEELVDEIMKSDIEVKIGKDSLLSKYSKKYIDYLELKELHYNIVAYASI